MHRISFCLVRFYFKGYKYTYNLHIQIKSCLLFSFHCILFSKLNVHSIETRIYFLNLIVFYFPNSKFVSFNYILSSRSCAILTVAFFFFPISPSPSNLTALHPCFSYASSQTHLLLCVLASVSYLDPLGFPLSKAPQGDLQAGGTNSGMTACECDTPADRWPL